MLTVYGLFIKLIRNLFWKHPQFSRSDFPSYILLSQLTTRATEKVQFYNISASKWDQEYKSGQWHYLQTIPIERARNSIISVLCDAYASNGSVLDVGSGEGVFSDFLGRQQKRRYMGIDISAKAIAIGKEKRPRLKFLVTTAEDFNTTRKFDIIVFNEVLYYTNHNFIMNKYKEFLSPNGLIIISVWFQEKGVGYPKKMVETIFSDAKLIFRQVDEMKLHGLKNNNPVSFMVGAFRIKTA
eukprot:gene13067-17516_t